MGKDIQKCGQRNARVWAKKYKSVGEEIQKFGQRNARVWATSTMSLSIPRHSLSHTLMPSAFPYLICIGTTSLSSSSSSSSSSSLCSLFCLLVCFLRLSIYKTGGLCGFRPLDPSACRARIRSGLNKVGAFGFKRSKTSPLDVLIFVFVVSVCCVTVLACLLC